jgi:hypothetical protein
MFCQIANDVIESFLREVAQAGHNSVSGVSEHREIDHGVKAVQNAFLLQVLQPVTQ